jgi:hypothetical protein
MRKTRFVLEAYGNNSFEGYSDNSDWNGWACPYFTFEQAEKVLKTHNGTGQSGYYDESKDAFIFQVAGNNEPETYPAIKLAEQKYYPIGYSNWIWEEAETVY